MFRPEDVGKTLVMAWPAPWWKRLIRWMLRRPTQSPLVTTITEIIDARTVKLDGMPGELRSL